MLAPSNQNTFVKVPARHLLRGDVTGSGEVVLNVSAGAKTPRGMVDVLLQKWRAKRAGHLERQDHHWRAPWRRCARGNLRAGQRRNSALRIVCPRFTSWPRLTLARRGMGCHREQQRAIGMHQP